LVGWTLRWTPARFCESQNHVLTSTGKYLDFDSVGLFTFELSPQGVRWFTLRIPPRPHGGGSPSSRHRRLVERISVVLLYGDGDSEASLILVGP
jgi:hypothetical protein